MLLIALSLAEICSAYPTMGGLYYWVCRMRPKTPFIGCKYQLFSNSLLGRTNQEQSQSVCVDL